MEINRAAFGALAVIGVVAAGGGAYLANRHNEAALVQPAPMYAAPAEGVVTETENTIATAPAAAVELAPPAVARPPPRPRRSPNGRCAAASPAPQRTHVAVTAATPVSVPPLHRRALQSIGGWPPPSVTQPTVGAPIVQEPPRKTCDELFQPTRSSGCRWKRRSARACQARRSGSRASVARQVRDQVAIPAGARAEGSVTLVERGGRLKDRRASASGSTRSCWPTNARLPINTETIYRGGRPPRAPQVAAARLAARCWATSSAARGRDRQQHCWRRR
jgi:hypothetical protein